MKKGVLILLGMVLLASPIEAKETENLTNSFRVNYYSYNNAVNFFENGIEFFVFTNGDFDFDLNYTNRRVRIDRDFDGRIRRIGNVRVRYDFRGNVSRIGDIRINYFRNRLRNVGDLRVRYNSWGTPIFYGNVRNFYINNGIRFNVSFGDVCDYNDPFFFRNDFSRSYTQFREDRNFYYYKARPNARVGKRSSIIKRRKPAAIRGTNNSLSRRTNVNSYRKNESNRRLSTNNNTTKSRRSIVKNNDLKRNTSINNRNSEIKKRTLNSSSNRNIKSTRDSKLNRRQTERKKDESKTTRKRRG